MSKLGTSLRNSITAEKNSFEDKPDVTAKHPLKKPLRTKAAVPAKVTKVKSKPVAKPVTQVLANKYTSFNTATAELPAKSSSGGLYHENRLILLMLKLTDKHTTGIVDATTKASDIAHEYMSIPLKGLKKLADLNAKTTSKIIQETANSIQDMAGLQQHPKIAVCLNQMIEYAARNNKSYIQELSATVTDIQNQMQQALNNQYSYAAENALKFISGFGVFGPMQAMLTRLNYTQIDSNSNKE